MSRRQVIVEYSGSTAVDIDGSLIADNLTDKSTKSTDAEIVKAIDAHIAECMEMGDPSPPRQRYRYDREVLIASVRAELARRKESE